MKKQSKVLRTLHDVGAHESLHTLHQVVDDEYINLMEEMDHETC